jgi:2-phosphoglycolate phosphatase
MVVTLPRPSAVLFDLDGTLVDSRGDIAAACNAALRRRGHKEESVERIGSFVGDGARVLIAGVLGLPIADPEVTLVLEGFVEAYGADPASRTTLMRGALEALDAVDAHGLRAAVVTNKPRGVTLKLLEAKGVLARFGAVCGGGDAPLKPSPALLERAAEGLGATKERVWMVGDGHQDILAGHALGATTIAVLGGFAREDEVRATNPHVVVASLVELPALLAASMA